MAQVASTHLSLPGFIANPPASVDSFSSPVHELHQSNGNVNRNTGPKQDSSEDLSFDDLPPFPDDVPTVPLLRISLKKLLSGNKDEIDDLWKACCEIGFFYLDLRGALSSAPASHDNDAKHGSGRDTEDGDDGSIDGDTLLTDARELFSLGEKFFALSVDEKQQYDLAHIRSYYGYKGYGKGISDRAGTKDRNEFYNTAKDDVFGISEPLPQPEVLRRDESRVLFRRYMQGSHAIISLILDLLNTKLGLPQGTLAGLHRLRAPSGDQVRFVRSPPQPVDDRQRALGEHTDFGSVTLLMNRLGGLQVLPPGEDSRWCYVKPLKGHCVINLGDAMVKFTAGVLRSNIHRVVNPPGEQENETRMSLVYFSRPEDEVILRVLEDSDMIQQRKPEYVAVHGDGDVSAKEWTLRRAFGRRGIGEYVDGTEDKKLD